MHGRPAHVGAVLLSVGIAALVAGVALAARPGASATLAITDTTTVEGSGGTTALTFTVSLSGSPSGTVTVSYATENGTASAPSDYLAATGILSLSKKLRSRTVSIQVVPDAVAELDETMEVRLTGATGASVADGLARGTIFDDDGAGGGSEAVIAGVGDVACDPASSSFNGGQGTATECRQLATSDLALAGGYDAVLGLGDLQYEDGTSAKFVQSYAPSWGRLKAITHPVPGNHEYGTAGAAGYFQYFGAAAGDTTKGYYSFELGSWHVIALNSNCAAVACGVGSAQEQWLRADLAAHPAQCTLAYWHHPRFSSGSHGSDASYTAFWQALWDADADVVLVGHDHDYERFAPQRADGSLDATRGVREFVVGTGGKTHYTFSTIRANSEARDSTSFGILELTLRASGYDWRFRPAVGSFTDAGSTACH
jgi:acid phosphatase type 7